MGDDLQDKPRKELKELCSRNNIRTAGVKHEDLVRLLRNKLYPSSPFTPRSTSLKNTRGPKEPSPVKDTTADSYKTPVKSGGNKARNSRTPTLPRENETPKEFQRKNSGLSRKPLLTKSNTFSSRSRADGRPQVAPGADQENAYRRPVTSKVKGLSPLSRKSAEAPGLLETMSAHSESRLEDDSGSDASRRVSEIATDAGPDTMSDFSDADEFRSVSSEPISRLGKRSSLRTESSKMSLLSAQSGLSFFTAGSWSSDNSRSLDNLLDARRGDAVEDVFPEFPDGSDFLVDALEVSYLDAGAADPELVRFNAMHSPMARDYVNYNRGSETHVLDNCAGSSRASIASEEDKHPRDMDLGDGETSEDLVPSQNDLAPDASSDMAKEDCEVPEDDHQSKSADVEGPAVDTPAQCEPRAREDAASSRDTAQPTPEHEHSGSPEGEESGSPAFDYSVAKKLEFEPVEITTSPHAERNVEGEGADESKSQKIEPAVHVPAVDPSASTPTNAQEATEDPTEEATEEPGCPVDEREGSNVKTGDEQCDAVHDYNKDEREKEEAQATLSFPLSVIVWCSQSCSSTSGSRTQTLTS